MAFEESIQGLREFDINDLDFDNIGSKNKSLLMAHGKGAAVVVSP